MCMNELYACIIGLYCSMSFSWRSLMDHSAHFWANCIFSAHPSLAATSPVTDEVSLRPHKSSEVRLLRDTVTTVSGAKAMLPKWRLSLSQTINYPPKLVKHACYCIFSHSPETCCRHEWAILFQLKLNSLLSATAHISALWITSFEKKSETRIEKLIF